MFSDIDFSKVVEPIYCHRIICMDGKTRVRHIDNDGILAYTVFRGPMNFDSFSVILETCYDD